MNPFLRLMRHLDPLLLFLLCLAIVGCDHIHGRPRHGPEISRPEEVIDFHTLYKENCAACHGSNGRGGAAIALANPVYLSYAGEQNMTRVIATGVPGRLMPPFAKSSGGILTNRQIVVIAHGLMAEWNQPAPTADRSMPAYNNTLTPDTEQGQKAFVVSCARCHGATGEGSSHEGSIVDPTYLALVSDQYLRGIIVAGLPDHSMPDWLGDTTQPLTDQEITNIVAWLASNRVANPGQPYSSHP